MLSVSSNYACFFPSYLHRPHRDLHSFPTRRSSDLRYLSFANSSIIGINFVSLLACFTFLQLLQNLRSEEHTSELHHVSISYAVFCLKKKIPSKNVCLINRLLYRA